MNRYLYRGANSKLYNRNNGSLIPKALGKSFKSHPIYDFSRYGNATYGESEINAVNQHQEDSSKIPTSGISTTPIFENAHRYALHDGKYSTGFMYKIDTTLFDEYQVRAYVVADYATSPAIPGDEEIILVANDNQDLPREIIVEVIEVKK